MFHLSIPEIRQSGLDEGLIEAGQTKNICLSLAQEEFLELLHVDQ